jgi:hypothetical protein
MADNASFTFWSNMKETIDVFDDVGLKYKLYDTLVEFALYGVEPEADDPDYITLKMFLQSMKPSIEKSSGYHKKQSELGGIGGSNQQYSDDKLIEAVKFATSKVGKVPTRKNIVSAYEELYGNAPSEKTIGRRLSKEAIEECAVEALRSDKEEIKFDF